MRILPHLVAHWMVDVSETGRGDNYLVISHRAVNVMHSLKEILEIRYSVILRCRLDHHLVFCPKLTRRQEEC